ncbi:MAG TPA: tetratricopeptide repeat-containing glycosyltransferase family protein [Opitutaceae bacterium]|nr:tetratricopeptide repeat-containing glycosyltransferase family protein [Opitutaceae bacterium]
MSNRSFPRSQRGPAPSAVDPINTGVRLHETGKYNEAFQCFEAILKKQPRHPLALWHLGRALTRLKQPQQAIPFLEQAIALRPRAPEPLYDLAWAFLGAEQLEDAIAQFEAALALKPAWVEAWSALGYAQGKLRRFAAAEKSLQHALALKPDHGETFNRLGIIMGAQGRGDEATEYFFQAIKLAPQSFQAWSNLAGNFKAQNKMAEALVAYEHALAVDPKNSTVKYNQAIASLTLGDLRRDVWLRYEYRWVVLHKSPQRGFTQPLWRGESLEGKTILLHSEQGLGDTIQFVRYAAVLAAQGATVHVEVQPPLKSLLADLPGAASVIAWGEPLPDFDFQCPLLSLPFACDTQLDTIPAAVPYVRAPADRVATWRERLGPPRGFRVGLVWRGNPKHSNDANRSMPFEIFQRLCAVDGCEFVSLQIKLNEQETAFFAEKPARVNQTELIEDFSDTAAVISQLDVVIAVDTSVAHLAGAMGKPVWLLLPYSPDWRWLLERADSPWYPGMRLFRQPAVGDWDSVVANVAQHLVHEAGSAHLAA